jgi:hypothetical protein
LSPNSLFTIIIRIFGLWLIFGLLDIIPQAISMTPLLLSADLNSKIMAAAISIVILGLNLFLIWAAVFRTGNVIKLLSLNKGFNDEHIDVNLSSHAVLRVALIVLGGVLLIQNVPVLFSDLVLYIRQIRSALPGVTPSFHAIVLSGSKILIGYLLMDHNQRIALWFGRMAGDK